MPTDRTRRPRDPFAAAEAAFKKPSSAPAAPAPKPPSVPNAKELVSLRIDREVLDYFQQGGAGWQDRINDALKASIGPASQT